MLITGPTLEEELKRRVWDSQDLYTNQPDHHFLVPNEREGTKIQPHFRKGSGGYHVCVGTERLFMNLALCETRDGVIGIDNDRQVVAYNYFNALLLRIAKNKEDFVMLATQQEEYVDENSWKEKLQKIRDAIRNSLIDEEWKDYFLRNLEDYARFYYPAKQKFLSLCSSYRNSNNSLIPYHSEEKMFNKVQRYAKEGQMIFVLGDINDLSFINSHRISEIDVSNIPQYYSIVDPKFQDHNNTSTKIRIIWTNIWVTGSYFISIWTVDFYSYQLTPLTDAERKKLEAFIVNNPGLAARKREPYYKLQPHQSPFNAKPSDLYSIEKQFSWIREAVLSTKNS